MLAHEEICMRIAAEAERDGCRYWLAVIYDRLVRTKWHNLAYNNVTTFDVNRASLVVDTVVLNTAKSEFTQRSRSNGKGYGKGDGKGDGKAKGKGKNKGKKRGADDWSEDTRAAKRW